MEINIKKGLKRKKKIDPCPNPLFLQWLTEWRDEAAANGWKSYYNYAKALNSLKKYPLHLQSGKEAKILEYFGDKICGMLDSKLAKYKASNGPDTPISSPLSSNNTSPLTCPVLPSRVMNKDQNLAESKQKKPRKKVAKEYIPVYRSGAYAILIALYKNHQNTNSTSYLLKTQLQQQAQPYSEKSMTVPDPGSHYTAWSSMKSLSMKKLVAKESNPAKYSITEAGCELAHKLLSVHNASLQSPQLPSVQKKTVLQTSTPKFEYWFVDNNKSLVSKKSEALVYMDDEMFSGCLILCKEENLQKSGKRYQLDFSRKSKEPGFVYAYLHCDDADVVCPAPPYTFNVTSSNSSQTSISDGSQEDIPSYSPFILHPRQFDIVLCVDNTETTGGAQSRKLNLLPELNKNGVNLNVRKLHIGDFLWIAKEKVIPAAGQLHLPNSQELVLNYIVERKRMDDLCKSIMDGRFHEQKFRLKNSGLSQLIYLVEDFGSNQQYVIPEVSLEQAIVNTQIVDGFFVKRTQDQKESVAYLTIMTRYLQSLYKHKTLISCSREKFFNVNSRADISDGEQLFMTFQEFNSGSVKNKMMNVTEVFTRQLMQFSSLSSDKAISIVDKYKTPALLLEAYENCNSKIEKEKLLANLKYGRYQRSIGPSLSRIVSMLYCTRDPLT